VKGKLLELRPCLQYDLVGYCIVVVLFLSYPSTLQYHRCAHRMFDLLFAACWNPYMTATPRSLHLLNHSTTSFSWSLVSAVFTPAPFVCVRPG